MSAIYINTGSGESKIYEEDQARALWMEGRFGEGSLYWREGMAEWQPISMLFPPTAVYQPTPPVRPEGAVVQEESGQRMDGLFPETATYRFTQDPSRLTQVLKAMLWIELAIMGASLMGDLSQMAMINRGFTTEEAEVNDARQSMMGLILLGVYLVTAITFMRWIYRANVNCRGFGAQGMTFTPGWSVGWYFVPFLNLVRPFQAMREIWQVSTNPKRWQTVEDTGLLTVWWTLWIITRILGQISFRMSMDVTDLSSLENATTVSIVTAVVEVPLSLVAIRMVGRIYEKQKALVDGGR